MSGYHGNSGAKGKKGLNFMPLAVDVEPSTLGDKIQGVKSIPNPLAKGAGVGGIGGIWVDSQTKGTGEYHKPSISYTGTTLLDYK